MPRQKITSETLANTTVTAGTYGTNESISQIVVDAQGRITSASSVSIKPTVRSLNYSMNFIWN